MNSEEEVIKDQTCGRISTRELVLHALFDLELRVVEGLWNGRLTIELILEELSENSER